ncbi:hypothetical protein [Pseudaestuariivita atlantica]|uniref:hypothetical protein n=1 Tax=Pseudaestuariivita atlantica TaxID=1317121 RepID=UPI0013F3EC34|nr:hypothetical protein [Pseudaestuariivita atlantica]
MTTGMIEKLSHSLRKQFINNAVTNIDFAQAVDKLADKTLQAIAVPPAHVIPFPRA